MLLKRNVYPKEWNVDGKYFSIVLTAEAILFILYDMVDFFEFKSHQLPLFFTTNKSDL